MPTLLSPTGSGGGGGIPEWAAGTYNIGDVVTRGPYVWRANATTTEDPLVVEGNLGLSADWAVQTVGGSGMVQGSNELLMIAAVNAKSTAAYRQSVNTGFLGKMLIADLSLQGSADGIYLGVYDSTAAQTATNVYAGGSTLYGIRIDIFNGRIEATADGSAVGTFSYTRANAINAIAAYSRWYVSMVENGANWNLLVYRDARAAAVAATGHALTQVEDLILLGQFTNVARPAYSNWRFVVGAYTGGANGTFKCRNAWVRDISSGNWTAIGRAPTQLG